jgi:hypothetical protein
LGLIIIEIKYLKSLIAIKDVLRKGAKGGSPQLTAHQDESKEAGRSTRQLC